MTRAKSSRISRNRRAAAGLVEERVAAGGSGVGTGVGAAGTSRPQCLQTIAASWISSAQNGHFFMVPSVLCGRQRLAPAPPRQATLDR
jgi:hypothetical protein